MNNIIPFKKVLSLIFLLLTSNLYLDSLTVTVFDRDLDLPLEGVRVTETQTGTESFTDFNGKTVLDLIELDRAILLIELVGYEAKKQLVTDFSTPLDIYMLMEGVLEGEELVVEVEAIGETDAEVGVSTVVEEEVIQAAAKIGFMEDAMSAVKILPGVTYSGGMASNLSIRGSDPNGFSAVMDGMIIDFPYHFGGMVSIFNPNIVESIKFSPGIFSVKHGEATSALLEVKTITPDDGFKFNILTSSSTTEAFFQVPINKNKAGIMAGLRLTYWEPALRLMGWIGEQINSDELKFMNSAFKNYPYIYDFYFKGFYKPNDRLNLYLNSFSGNDGIGFQIPDLPDSDKTKEILYTGESIYSNNDFFISTGASFLAKDNLLINLMLGQEIWLMDIDAYGGLEGTQVFSDKFKKDFNLPIDSVYITEDLYLFDMNFTTYNSQARLDTDWSLSENLLIQGGVGTAFTTSSWKTKGFMRDFMNYSNSSSPKFEKDEFDNEGDGDKRFSSFAYGNLNADITKALSVEAGVRLDHFYQESDDEELGDINTTPVFAPRVRLKLSPGIGSDLFKKNSFTLGVGLFNKAPWKTGMAKIPSKSLTTVVGWDTHLPFDMHFKVEGYYKYIYDRTYVNTRLYEDSGLKDITHTNGFGHIAGGDLLLERKISRYIDGMLSYTYVWARYQDPTLEEGYKYDLETEAPRGEYYWPSFHRFHSFNLLFNIKPTDGFKITTKFSIASGLPKRTFKETPVLHMNGNNGESVPMEMYDSKNIYSETNRADYEFPLDIKFVWHNYNPKSKYNWEYYIGIENVLYPLLLNLNTSGSEQGSLLRSKSESKDNSFARPIMPSFGFRVTF